MPGTWTGRLIERPTLKEVAAVLPDYEVMLLSILDAILERHERDPDYPFVDTKLEVLTGRDFPAALDAERDFKSRDAIFGWIQGRGLESLAGHAEWLPTVAQLSPTVRSSYLSRISRMAASVMDRMEELRSRSDGRVSFLMTREGRPFDLGPDGRRRFVTPDPATTGGADLFYAKGAVAAARLLSRPDQVSMGTALFRQVTKNIEEGRHHTDQISFDPKNQGWAEPGRRSHAWHMIAILGCAESARFFGDAESFATGERFIRHVIDQYINRGQWSDLRRFDFVEAVDLFGRPWRANGKVLCDPGHVMEFIGLATKLLLVMRDWPGRTAAQEALISECQEIFPPVFLRTYAMGSNRRVGGICKAVNLLTRRPMNPDMPWWNLPETMRAASELIVLHPKGSAREELLRVIQECSNAFVRNFVNPACHLMAYQTVDENGVPIEVIPATPDADPGYHTGLSIIDFMACIRRLAHE